MKIYIVTTGRYDDYTINSVFSSEDKARAHIDRVKATPDYSWQTDFNDYIEEWEVDTETEEKC